MTKILFQGTRACWLLEEHRGLAARWGSAPPGPRPARSSCAGGRSTPRSCSSCPGVGAAARLRELGIDVVADLPGVGENLQDHLEVFVQHVMHQPVSIGRRLSGATVDYRLEMAVPEGPDRGHQPLRGRRLREDQPGRALPEPDVPLPANREQL